MQTLIAESSRWDVVGLLHVLQAIGGRWAQIFGSGFNDDYLKF